MEKRTLQMTPISFVPGPEDRALGGDDYQHELGDLLAVLRSEKVLITTRMQFRDAVGADAIGLGQFSIEALKVLGPLASAAFGAWLHKRYGRKVRIKIGEIEAEAQSVAEIEQLLQQAANFERPRIQVGRDGQ